MFVDNKNQYVIIRETGPERSGYFYGLNHQCKSVMGLRLGLGMDLSIYGAALSSFHGVACDTGNKTKMTRGGAARHFEPIGRKESPFSRSQSEGGRQNSSPGKAQI
ncbi:MAG: hypothetical protein R3D86_05520 [Emcibacteraceae bacterium]